MKVCITCNNPLQYLDAGLDNLEAQGLIRKKSDRKCLFDYELTDDGEYSLEQYQKISTLR